jgi:alkaline phosphatase D
MKQLLILSSLVLMLGSCGTGGNSFKKSWTEVNDRVWVGPEFWSNRLQDWKVQNGRLECVAENPRLMMRTTHLINLRLSGKDGNFSASVDLGALQSLQNDDASCGILIGAGPRLDVWGASLVQQNTGPGGGLYIGINAAGDLFVKDMEDGEIRALHSADFSENNVLTLEANHENDSYSLTLKCNEFTLNLPGIEKGRLIGNIALVSHPGEGENPGTFWFNNLEVKGSKLEKIEETAGPIISTQYTLSRSILKMTAQMAPVSEMDPKQVFLEVKRDAGWEEISETEIITPGYTATFRVADWDSFSDIPYRVKYIYGSSESGSEIVYWEGMVRHDPVDKDEIVIAGFTGNHNIAHPGLSRLTGNFNFDSSGIWYPHTDIVKHVRVHDPDILFFSGDQVYEGDSPTFPDRDNYELDYLYKWYLYCLAYRNLTRDIPTISIPDDHDVYQGNLWGQGGRPAKVDNEGGYVHPAWFVQMVERTQCSNLPDPYDPTPLEQNIGVYYTSLTYGGIGFAVLEDRKFKSGCADHSFFTKGRPDHVIDPEFDVDKIDFPGKKLLGDRQLEFLDDWSLDWVGHEMKIALSQTIFAGMATHHGGNLMRIRADLDSNGWPQTGRNKAIDALRRSFTFHLAGDQHLASIVHHGIDEWGDGIYSFCVPSIANFYPRAWWPESIGIDRPEGTRQNMGKHKDGFGNFVTVYGVTNPTSFTDESTGQDPLVLHDKMPGYGIVKMNKDQRTITMECWPRWADPLRDKPYEGWPKTIKQEDNYGRQAIAYLPVIQVEGIANPVIEIRDEKNGETVYCLRIKGDKFRPKIFEEGIYSIIVGDPENKVEKTLKGLTAANDAEESVVVSF